MELQIFQNAEFGSVRAATIDGEPYFVGKDVAEILGYSDPQDALGKHVDEEDKLVLQKSQIAILEIPNRGLTVINESGLYSLILRSQLPAAKKFKRWVTTEVLPTIRKYGMYAIDDILANPDLAIAALQALKEEREKRQNLELMTAVQRQQIAEMKPKVSYYDQILQNKNTVPVTQIAKDYGMSGRKFNALLHELGIQYKFRKTWLLYQEYAEQGYTQSRTYALECEKSVMHTYWTQKGRLFLYDRLKKEGILPRIEMEG